MNLADLVLAYCRIVDAHQFNKQTQVQQYEAYAAMRDAARKIKDVEGAPVVSARFEISREPMPATYGGIFGGKADHTERYIAGVPHYYVDGQEVSADDYQRLLSEQTTP